MGLQRLLNYCITTKETDASEFKTGVTVVYRLASNWIDLICFFHNLKPPSSALGDRASHALNF